MNISEILGIVKSLVSIDDLFSMIGEKLVDDYKVVDIDVKRVRDAVVLVIKAQSDASLIKIEEQLREAISRLGICEEKIEVKLDGS